jgi:hypothetical protein
MKLCPLKFNIGLLGTIEEVREQFNKNGLSVSKELMECEESQCEFWSCRQHENLEFQNGCALRLLAEK